MDFEFDKEIDAILRKARGDEIAATAGAHLDADEIAAFAENALPDGARQRFTAHFADCARCRKILSNVFVYNTEAEIETASSVVSVPVETAAVPWYRKLFAFPQAAYAMGAMVLLFSGFFGYLILQNLPGADKQVSYSANTASSSSAPATERPAAMSNSNATSAANTTATNSAANSPFPSESTNSAANSARLSTSNTTTAAATPSLSQPQQPLAQPENETSVAEVQPMATPAPKPQAKDDAEADNNLAKVAPATPVLREDPNASGAAIRRNERTKEESYSVDGSSGSSDSKTREDKSKNARAMQNAPQKKNSSGAGEQRSVGGKTFNNVGGIWFDSAVGNRKPKTVNRGTGEYQKLDAGLRSIADSLGGTVVILWGGKAYRIQ